MPSDLITCIYCREQKPGSREHILATSLGGDATSLEITCQSCNGGPLSRLDQAMAERSLVALSRAADTSVEAFAVQVGGEHFHYDAAMGTHLEVKLTNEMRAVLLPQIHADLPTGKIEVVASGREDVDALVKLIDDRIAKSKFSATHVKVGPANRCATARLVMHRSNDFFARVREQAEAADFLERLEAKWPEVRAQMLESTFTAQSIPTPNIEITMTVRLDETFRAVAKTAFNVLATNVGKAFALSPEFDELRAYVLGKDIRHPSHLEPGQVAVDTRFVQMVPFGEPPLVPTDRHAVTLFYAAPLMLAYITFYAHNSFVVKLGSVMLPDPVLVTHEFSTVRNGNVALPIVEVYERLKRVQGG